MSGLTPDDEAIIRAKTRSLVGIAALRRLHVLVRAFQADEEFKRRSLGYIVGVLAALIGGALVVFYVLPPALAALVRALS